MNAHAERLASRLRSGGGGEVFFGRERARLHARSAQEPPPEQDPSKACRAGDDERRAPPVAQRQIRNRQRGEDRADIRAAVEDAGGQGALRLRKPIRHRADGGWKVRRLAQSEGEARDSEAHRTACQRVRHGRRAPQGDGHRVAQARARPVDEAAGERHHQRIGQLESEDDPAVVRLAPVELGCERRLEQPEHLAIDVVDGGGEEKQCAYAPAEPRCGLAREEVGHL